ncbi:purine-nucleoside phosphorylase [Agrilactobacillus yilanensis]|uniref:Purine nucleoside phosphorylase DeoD-type n=1 Tax=Agrilactobacillus yilanensis TaxID=2485997 RepID=A0ABW4J4I0_9LACO|nr:purine-nucleoside phosphorylase [Agrilactobacillus yilanensis]
MSTHINADSGAIAEKVLLPGDPLRAKFIAENFLTDSVCYNTVRSALGYTGLYHGQRVSVQATGMGMPSMAIYAHELIVDYQVQQLIRVGTAGGLAPQLQLRDIVLAQGASTDSSMPQNIFGSSINFAPLADFELLHKAFDVARAQDQSVTVGNVLGQDRFYDDAADFSKLINYGILAAEMETPALYLAAAQYQRQALAILTISNHIITGAETSAQAREQEFGAMVQLALKTLCD